MRRLVATGMRWVVAFRMKRLPALGMRSLAAQR
jgi:hypothetical protein